jgi:hypothetical protein
LKQAEALAAAQQSIAANSWVIDHHVLLVIHGYHLFCLTHLCGVMWGRPEIAISIGKLTTSTLHSPDFDNCVLLTCPEIPKHHHLQQGFCSVPPWLKKPRGFSTSGLVEGEQSTNGFES